MIHKIKCQSGGGAFGESVDDLYFDDLTSKAEKIINQAW